MKYCIQDILESNLYVASYWKTGFNLKEIDHALIFKDEKEAKAALNILARYANLKIVENLCVLLTTILKRLADDMRSSWPSLDERS
jgi:hypothetical protein